MRVDNESAVLAAVRGTSWATYLERHQVVQLRSRQGPSPILVHHGRHGRAAWAPCFGPSSGVLADMFRASRASTSTRADRMGMRLDAARGLRTAARRRDGLGTNLLAVLRVTEAARTPASSGDIVRRPHSDHRTGRTRRPAAARRRPPAASTGADAPAQGRSRPCAWAGCRDEVKRGQYEESLVLFDRLLPTRALTPECSSPAARSTASATSAGDLASRALADPRSGPRQPCPSVPPEAFRAPRPWCYKQRKRPCHRRREAFGNQLSSRKRSPGGFDARMVRGYLAELKPMKTFASRALLLALLLARAPASPAWDGEQVVNDRLRGSRCTSRSAWNKVSRPVRRGRPYDTWSQVR
jgi:hypothetical protein